MCAIQFHFSGHLGKTQIEKTLLGNHVWTRTGEIDCFRSSSHFVLDYCGRLWSESVPASYEPLLVLGSGADVSKIPGL